MVSKEDKNRLTCVNNIMQSPGRTSRAAAARKVRKHAITLAEFCIVAFPVSVVHSLPVMRHRLAFSAPNPIFAYEKSPKNSANAAPPADSGPDATDGLGTRSASLSRRAADASAHGTGMASGGGRPVAQTRTRRILNL